MIINQTRIETPAQTFVPGNTSTNAVPFISYIRKEKSKNVIILSSDEENSEDEEPTQPEAQPMDEEPQTVSLSSSTRPNKQRKIEGSQNAPISLDDSDDDMAEIIEQPESFLIQKKPFDNALTQSIVSSVASSPMAQFEDYCDDNPPIDQQTFDQNFLKFVGSFNEDKKDELNDETKQEIASGINQELSDKKTDESSKGLIGGSTDELNAGSTDELKIGLQGGLNNGLIGEFTYAVIDDPNIEEKSDDAMAIDDQAVDQSYALKTDQAMDQNHVQNNDLVNDQDGALIEDHLDDSFSVLSELSDVAFEQLSRMSVREGSVKEEELHNAINITETMTQLTVDEAMPSTSVNTFIPDNVEKLELLRMMEMYIQSVSEPPSIANLIGTNERSSRRSKRHTESSSPVVYYRQKSNIDSQAQPTLHPQEPNTPYVPSRVWYNSTWEDWAQLDTADILHYPFTTQEISIIEHCTYKAKGSKITRDLEAYWQYVSTQLPGRTPLDCKCFYSDLQDGQYQLFDKVIMVRKHKAQKKGRSRYQLLSKRTRTGALNGNTLRSIHLANMSRESTIQVGSGDAITLAIFNDPTKGVRIAAGSLCDENIQYNVPGNLRLWDSETNECKSLSGHQTAHETTGQGMWIEEWSWI
ncbi:hypothetical protein G6F42_015900 [Rhizopus arrhizus]|nr:hypothetical protein G6F42_015900 [Rhizopus arrhizus]